MYLSTKYSIRTSLIIMLKVILLLFLVSTSYGFHGRIVNGTDAEPGEFPFIVALRIGGALQCGATILNEKFILTASHCVCLDANTPYVNPADLTIQYGLINITTDDTNSAQVQNITCNPDYLTYDPKYQVINDIAVLELVSPLPEDGQWERVRVAVDFDTSEQQKGVIIGWGSLSEDGGYPDVLQKVEIDIYNDEVCGKYFNLDLQVCLGGDHASACHGDSGGPLVINGNVQTGVTSFETATCGQTDPQHPDIYTRVPAYVDWIKELAGDIETWP